VLAEPAKGRDRAIAQLVQLGEDRFVDDLTVDTFGDGEQDFGGGREADQVGTIRVRVHRADIPRDEKFSQRHSESFGTAHL
jgi:hypothetical protein